MSILNKRMIEVYPADEFDADNTTVTAMSVSEYLWGLICTVEGMNLADKEQEQKFINKMEQKTDDEIKADISFYEEMLDK